jgi:exopolyphosphatase/guanosine-5'-triphosphate,3'-diphosphate pyrophosphatase
MKYAAIDIGTNAARLLIGEVCSNNGFSYVKKISYTRVPLRLGEEVFEDGIISEKKTERFLKTIKAFKLLADVYQVKAIRACATSAMREAENGEQVRKKIKKETGVEIEIISGDEEAELIFGTFFLLDFDKNVSFIVIDVGGGSTEVSVFENGERIAAKSFEIGTIRLLKNKVKPTIWKDIHQWIEQHVDLDSIHNIFATGGNINKVHKIIGAPYMEAIPLKKVTKLRDTLEKLSLEERIDKYQLKADRADVIVPAMNIYIYIMEELKCNQMVVPKIGLSDGMIYDLHLKERGNLNG